MRTVLHIGMPKTGTTALQTCFHKSYDTLLDHGVLYPRYGRGVRYSKHILLVQPVLEFKRLPRSLRQKKATPEDLERSHRVFFEAVRSQIADNKPECVVLSAENLSRPFTKTQMDVLANELEGLGVGEVEVAVYLRRPSSHFLSGLQQKLKASHKLKQPSARAYRSIIEAYSGRFGAQSVRPRVFDRTLLVDGDIVADFCTSHLARERIDPKSLRPGDRSNETMCAETMKIVWQYRWDFERDNDDMHTRGSRQLRAALLEAEPKVGVERPRLRDGIAEIIDHASEDVLWLRDTYGLEFPGLDYSVLERGGPKPVPKREYDLRELVEVDPKVQTRLIDALARSSWARSSAERSDWVSGLLGEVT